MVAKSEMKIFFKEKTPDFPTIFMDGLNFLKSYWQFSHVNVNMINCHAAFLLLGLKYSKKVIMNNCTFGNWTFTQVHDVLIKNGSNSIGNGFITTLNFNNSTGLIENITLKDLNFSRILEGLIIQNTSNINVTKSNFVNNFVKYGLIKVLSSSRLFMSETNMQYNQARDYSGAIYLANSIVHLENTNFSNNKAVKVGGAICALANSSLWIAHSTFKNNHIQYKDSVSIKNISKYASGGAIYFENSSVLEMQNVNFSHNAAYQGGAISFLLHSKLNAQNVSFKKNTGSYGSVIYGYRSVNFSCKDCLFYENIVTSNTSKTNGGALEISKDSLINITGVTCKNHSSHVASCIRAYENCSVAVYNSTFIMNTESVISLHNSHLFIVGSSFFNNSAPETGAAINSYNSTLHVSDSDFYHNKAMVGGGALSLILSAATVKSCTFFNNSNTALTLIANTIISIANSIFENNSSPWMGAAQYISNFSEVNISNTRFWKNSASNAGAIFVMEHSLLVISQCLFSENSALPGASKLKFETSELNMLQSLHSLNFTSYLGGSIFSGKSSLLIRDTMFEGNVAHSSGGSISISSNSLLVIENSQFRHNSAQDKAVGSGGGLCIGLNSTATISDVYFFENKALQGGAIYAFNFCQITISNNKIEANTGSAIAFQNSVYCQINNSRFSNNLSSLKGGAILSKSSCKLHVTKTLFKANKAIYGGGSFFGLRSFASFGNCSFTDNVSFKGGALAADDSNVELLFTNFTKNNATEGGAFATNGNLLIFHCIMNNNTAHGHGGAGYIEENSQINITTSNFWFDSALNAGGVLWVRESIVTITNSYITFNWAGVSGGVIDAQFSSVICITHTTCFGNKIKGGKGGVLGAKRNTTVWLHSSEMQNNSARGCAVMWIDTSSVLEISDSLLDGNYADVLGGAFCILNNSLSVIMNSSFRRNTAYHAGSIVIRDGVTYLENCTLTGNHGTVAGAITIASSDLKLSHTVFFENKAEEGDDIHYEASETKSINKFYTYRCKFAHANTMVTSDVTSFEQIAQQKDFMGPFNLYNQTNLQVKETQFASSKDVFVFPFKKIAILILIYYYKVSLFSFESSHALSLHGNSVLKEKKTQF